VYQLRVLLTPVCERTKRAGVKRFALALLVTFFSGGVAGAQELLVFAAASTTDALGELGSAYEAASHVRVRFSFAGSSDLARQILAGAPADVFLSADDAQMDRVQAAGRVRAEDRVELLSNVLAVAQSSGQVKAIERPAELAAVKRLALADPDVVPAGVYAKRWLQSLGVWEAARPHVIPTLDVRAALAAVESGRADACIVYETDLRMARRARPVPRQTLLRWGAMPPIRYPVAAVTGAHADLARAFVSYLSGAKARDVFGRYGFSGPSK
jgi:molybdate transport system substrate-binding protein